MYNFSKGEVRCQGIDLIREVGPVGNEGGRSGQSCVLDRLISGRDFK